MVAHDKWTQSSSPPYVFKYVGVDSDGDLGILSRRLPLEQITALRSGERRRRPSARTAAARARPCRAPGLHATTAPPPTPPPAAPRRRRAARLAHDRARRVGECRRARRRAPSRPRVRRARRRRPDADVLRIRHAERPRRAHRGERVAALAKPATGARPRRRGGARRRRRRAPRRRRRQRAPSDGDRGGGGRGAQLAPARVVAPERLRPAGSGGVDGGWRAAGALGARLASARRWQRRRARSRARWPRDSVGCGPQNDRLYLENSGCLITRARVGGHSSHTADGRFNSR